MKTPLILRDDVVRQAKSKAALRGQPLSKYVEETLEREFKNNKIESTKAGDWLRTLPRLSEAAKMELSVALNDKELRTIDKEMWK